MSGAVLNRTMDIMTCHWHMQQPGSNLRSMMNAGPKSANRPGQVDPVVNLASRVGLMDPNMANVGCRVGLDDPVTANVASKIGLVTSMNNNVGIGVRLAAPYTQNGFGKVPSMTG